MGTVVRTSGAAPDVRYRRAGWVASAASVLGLAYTAISAYWGLGGKWLLATVGSSLDTDHQSLPIVLAAVVVKGAGALIPLQACRPARPTKWQHWLRLLGWTEGAVLTVYGFAFTAVGLLVQATVIHPGKTADRRALAWHTYLWDPWFLVWGVLVLVALALTIEQPEQHGPVRD